MKQKLCKFFVESYRKSYAFWNLPFGAKQEETFENDFWLRYNEPKNSHDRKKLAWDFWEHRQELRGI